MSRPATGVDISTLPRKAVTKQMADRTYEKYLRKIKDARAEINWAIDNNDDAHLEAWQKALTALEENLRRCGREVPGDGEIDAALTQKAGRQSKVGEALNTFTELMKDPPALLEEIRARSAAAGEGSKGS